MDCTFCLDCIHACPYDNIGMAGRALPASCGETRGGRHRRFLRPAGPGRAVVVLTFGVPQRARHDPARLCPPGRAVLLLGTAHRAGPGADSPSAWSCCRPCSWPRRAADQVAGARAHPYGPSGRYVWTLALMGLGCGWPTTPSTFTGALTVVPVIQSFLADVAQVAGCATLGPGPHVPLAGSFRSSCCYTGRHPVDHHRGTGRPGPHGVGAACCAASRARRGPVAVATGSGSRR